MTDRDKMIEAIFREISETQKGGGSLWEAATAVLDMCGTEPLVWNPLGDGKGRYRLDSSISVASHINGPYFVSLSCNSGSDYYWSGPNHSGGKYYLTLEAAQAAAQAHADAAHWAPTPLGQALGLEEDFPTKNQTQAPIRIKLRS